MRQKIIWLILILGMTSSAYLASKALSRPKNIPKGIESLPAVNLLLTDSQTVISTADAKKHKATVLFYFDPNCDHCQHQTEDIIANKDILKKVNFYFISLDSLRRIKKFKDYYHLQDISEITVAKDYEYNAFKTFKIESIPTNIVYNSNHKIVKIYPGGMSVSQLKNVLNL